MRSGTAHARRPRGPRASVVRAPVLLCAATALLCAACTDTLGVEDAVFACSDERPCGPDTTCHPTARICVSHLGCGNGVLDPYEACDDDAPGCERCTLARIGAPMFVPELRGLDALALSPRGHLVALGYAASATASATSPDRRPVTLALSSDGVVLARHPIACDGRDFGQLHALVARSTDLVATGTLYGVATGDLRREGGVVHLDSSARVLLSLDDRGAPRACAVRARSPGDSAGRALARVPGTDDVIVVGYTSRTAVPFVTDDGWIERIDGALMPITTSSLASDFRALGVTIDTRDVVYVVGRRELPTGPQPMWIESYTGLHQPQQLWHTDIVGYFSAATTRGPGAQHFGQHTTGGRPFVQTAGPGEPTTLQPLALVDAREVEVLAAVELSSGRTAVAGRFRRADTDEDSGFLVYLAADGATTMTAIVDDAGPDRLVALVVEGPQSLLVAGQRGGRAVLERWRY